MSAGTPILYGDLNLATQNFTKMHFQKYGISCSELEFKKSIKELENTFIITNRNHRNQITIQYKNPSVQDFLVNYFKYFPDSINDIIESAIFLNQLFNVFTIDENHLIDGKIVSSTNKILLTEKSKQLLKNKLLTDYESLNSSQMTSTAISRSWVKPNYSNYQKLNDISKEFTLEKHPDIRDFVSKTFAKFIIPNNFDGDDSAYYLNLLSELKDDYDFDKLAIIKKYFKSICVLQQTRDFERFKSIWPENYEEFIKNPDNYHDKINDLIDQETERAEDDDLDYSLRVIKSASEIFDINCDDAIRIIEDRIEAKEQQPEEEYDWGEEYYKPDSATKETDEDVTIENMFDSLLT